MSLASHLDVCGCGSYIGFRCLESEVYMEYGKHIINASSIDVQEKFSSSLAECICRHGRRANLTEDSLWGFVGICVAAGGRWAGGLVAVAQICQKRKVKIHQTTET